MIFFFLRGGEKNITSEREEGETQREVLGVCVCVCKVMLLG